MARAWLLVAALLAAPVGARAQGLTFYFIDVEGGQATLIVTPAGESLLIDAGYGGSSSRDAKRIAAVAREAKLERIDYFLLTHFHSDHDGGVPELAKLVPIQNFIDYGSPTEKGKKVAEPFDAYAKIRPKDKRHIMPKPGDRLPLKGLTIDFVSANGKTIEKPLAGGGQPNPACSSYKRRTNDFTENARSLGITLQFGKFRFLDPGDLVWNELGQLVCPSNLVGEVDVYLVAHHGNAFSALPAVSAALKPRVAIMNNGETKGGVAASFNAVRSYAGLEDLWQLHRSANKGAVNSDESVIANLDEHTAHRITMTANEDGSFTIVNGRTGFSKHYDARP